MFERFLSVASLASILTIAPPALAECDPATLYSRTNPAYAAGDGPDGLAIADLNGDMIPDIAVANRDSDDVSVLLGNGDGTFQNEQRYSAGNGAITVTIGDLNSDGTLDSASAIVSSDNVSVLLNLCGTLFEPEVRFPTGVAPSAVAVSNIDRDGNLDFATTNADSNE